MERIIAVRQGLHFLRAELPGILAKRTDVLSPRMLRVIEDLAGDWRQLDERIDALSDEIMTLAWISTERHSPNSQTAPSQSAESLTCRTRYVDWCADRAFCDSLMTHRPR